MKKVLPVIWLLGCLALLYLAIFHQKMWLLLIAIPLLSSFLKAIFDSVETDVIIPMLLGCACGICLVLALIKWSSTYLIISIACGMASIVPAFFKEVFTAPTYTKDEIMNMQPETKKDDKDASVVGRAVVGGVIAGGAGAVVGALSAIDKNNRKRSEKDKK